MSDKKKDISLDFGDLDGGTVQNEVEESNLPAVPEGAKTEEAKAPKKKYVSKTTELENNDIYLPVPTSNGGYQTKDIEDVTGEEFVAWIKNAWPMSPEWNPDPAKFDGENRTNKRIRYFWNIVERHTESVERQLANRKLRLKDLVH